MVNSMLEDRLTILKAVASFNGGGQDWETLVNTWPGDTLEEGQLFWSFLSPAAAKNGTTAHVWAYRDTFLKEVGRQRVYEALHAKFGPALWEHPTVNAVEATYRAYEGLPALMTNDGMNTRSGEQLPSQVSVLAFFMKVATPAYRAQQRERGQWAPRVAQWFGRPDDSHVVRDHLIQTTLTEGWVDPWSVVDGVSLPLYLRQPQDLAAWIQGGGDVDRRGLMPDHPEQPLWEILHARQPGLRKALMDGSHQAYEAFKNLPTAHQAQAALDDLNKVRNSKGTVAREVWWNHLTRHAHWPQLRAEQGDTPLWMAVLNQCPALLPLLIKEATLNPELQEHLKDTNRQGEGVWHVMLDNANSPSLKEALLIKLAHWAPPTSPNLWMGQSLVATEWPLDHRGLNRTGWTYRQYVENAQLRAVLPLAITLGTPEQQQSMVDQWKSHEELLPSLVEKEWRPHQAQLQPSLLLVAAVLSWLPKLLVKDSNNSNGLTQRRESWKEPGALIQDALEAGGVCPESMDAHLRQFRKKNDHALSPDAKVEFDRVSHLLIASRRQQQANEESVPARRRPRHRS
jgi:hypothetical protein